MNNQLPLVKNLHIRLDEKLETNLCQIAKSHFLAPSTFARVILSRHLPDYSKNRGFLC